ncbi:MAG: AAC(3) family N-acetyltransferase [Pseudomonadota bacterium]
MNAKEPQIGFDKAALVADLAALGVAAGDVLMVHSSLSAIGPVEGGADTVIDALLGALGPDGTLVMPAFRDSIDLPGHVTEAPEQVLAEAAALTPPFEIGATPTTMGLIPETFRRRSGVRRSPHPTTSITAFGPQAEALTAAHSIPWATGRETPFELLHEWDAKFLLIGVGFNRLTMLHYAETLSPHHRKKTRLDPVDGAFVLAPDVGDDLGVHFPALGLKACAEGIVEEGLIGVAPSKLTRARPIVALGRDYLDKALSGAPQDG